LQEAHCSSTCAIRATGVKKTRTRAHLHATYPIGHPSDRPAEADGKRFGDWEITNKLIRQYIPKKSDFDDISPHELLEIQKKLNNGPRTKLNLSTPKIEFFKHFA